MELKETVAWCWCGWWKVTVCNDADAAILAEQWVGAAKGGIKNFIMLSTIAAAPVTSYLVPVVGKRTVDETSCGLIVKRGAALGTGVGFGVVANGQLVRGGSNAIEGGHMVSKCLFRFF